MTALLALFLQDDSPITAPVTGGTASGILEMVRNSGPIAFCVLILLLLASIFSWSIILSKWTGFGRAQSQSTRFLRAFRKSGRLSEIATVADQFRPSPLVNIFTEIVDEYQRQSGGRGMPRNPLGLERAAQTAASEALTAMEKNMTWLSTIASTSTFLGLFGTVMGIIDAFHGLGASGAATLRAVAPGVSEALITTAAGILVAVPAYVGYNIFTGRLREFAARMDDFARELLNAIENAAMLPVPPEMSPQPLRRDLRNDTDLDPRLR